MKRLTLIGVLIAGLCNFLYAGYGTGTADIAASSVSATYLHKAGDVGTGQFTWEGDSIFGDSSRDLFWLKVATIVYTNEYLKFSTTSTNGIIPKLVLMQSGNIGISTISPNGLFIVGEGNRPPLTVLQGGNIGISNADPLARLSVRGDVHIFDGNVGIGNTTPTGSVVMSTGTGINNFYLQQNTGNIGIGTSQPVATFDCAGLIVSTSLIVYGLDVYSTCSILNSRFVDILNSTGAFQIVVFSSFNLVNDRFNNVLASTGAFQVVVFSSFNLVNDRFNDVIASTGAFQVLVFSSFVVISDRISAVEISTGLIHEIFRSSMTIINERFIALELSTGAFMETFRSSMTLINDRFVLLELSTEALKQIMFSSFTIIMNDISDLRISTGILKEIMFASFTITQNDINSLRISSGVFENIAFGSFTIIQNDINSLRVSTGVILDLIGSTVTWSASGINIWNTKFGNVGIGVTNPTRKLHITHTGFNDGITLESTDADSSFGPRLRIHRNSASPANADLLGLLQYDGQDSAGNLTSYASIGVWAPVVTNNSEEGEMQFYTNNNGTNTFRMVLNTNGNLGIGTSKPTSKLSVVAGTMTVTGGSLRIVDKAPPASTDAPGDVGEIRWGNVAGNYYIYVSTGANSWGRAQLLDGW